MFAFGAPFRGSLARQRLNRPVDAVSAFGDGYLLTAADGGVFDFSDRRSLGGLPPMPPTAPIVGFAAITP